ncbi:MAG TPA: FliH/SctL family protein [Planctomycetota bacterium]|nr:FliH/SctL family protein [Planctomycetota bacterium]
MQDIRPLPLKAFDDEVQAQTDLRMLREEIRALEAQRDAIKDAARRDGMELGRLDALEHATKMERERIATEAAGIVELLRKTAAGIEAGRTELGAAAERDLLKLALAVAAKIVKGAVADGRPVAEANLRRAVELTARRQELHILLHPEDVARIEQFLPELRREFSDAQKFVLDPDPSVARGGVVVQTREGSVDATIAAQLEEIERGLLG